VQEVTLVAQSGRELGTRSARRLRSEGMVPGVVYGGGTDARVLAVDWHELRSALSTAGNNALVNLQLDGTETLAIIKELQRDPVRLTIDHVDFLEVDPEAEITVEVPIVLQGTAEAVRRVGGVVEQTVNALVVRTTPRNIPQQLTADVSHMDLDDALHLSDLDVPDGIQIEHDPEEPIAVAKKSRRVIALEREEAEAELEGEEGAEEGAPSGEAEEAAGDGE
jgi:large subunit ribosomal protein L25